ncbi:MAG: hypothetical protein R2800_08060 [Flavipsychrobacter sp.]
MFTEEDITKQLQLLQQTVHDLIAFYQQGTDFDTMVYTYWSVKDVLGHVTFWHESFARNLKDIATGTKPHPLKGKLAEVNEQSVATNKGVSIPLLIQRLQQAQHTIEEHIYNTSITTIPYKKGSRDYNRLEHLEIVTSHINKHLKDVEAVIA